MLIGSFERGVSSGDDSVPPAAADRQGAYLARKIVAVTSWGSTWLQKNLFSEGKSSSSQKR